MAAPAENAPTHLIDAIREGTVIIPIDGTVNPLEKPHLVFGRESMHALYAMFEEKVSKLEGVSSVMNGEMIAKNRSPLLTEEKWPVRYPVLTECKYEFVSYRIDSDTEYMAIRCDAVVDTDHQAEQNAVQREQLEQLKGNPAFHMEMAKLYKISMVMLGHRAPL
jgi:hypothetical protein